MTCPPRSAGTRPTPRWRPRWVSTSTTVQDLDRISRTPASLDALVGDDGGTTLGDLVDASDASPEDLVVEADSRGELVGLVDRLTDRESEVIRCRYGLVPGPKQTYEEIAGRIGVSRERVRQIEREALERLRLWVSEPTDPSCRHRPVLR